MMTDDVFQTALKTICDAAVEKDFPLKDCRRLFELGMEAAYSNILEAGPVASLDHESRQINVSAGAVAVLSDIFGAQPVALFALPKDVIGIRVWTL